jgi:23S rRNA (cytidine1920-2'-O)/16S rRNA (cytidine1409-2'-O)-methyltransferase
VRVLDRTNVRELTGAQVAERIGGPPEVIVADLSFISLTLVLPAPLALAKSGAHLVALIKPQFEVGKARVGKGGVVRDPALHEEVCERIRNWFERQAGWSVLGIAESPILGPEGNKEFLIAARKSDFG